MKLTNRRNLFIYRLWALIYDSVFDRFFAAPGRKRAMQVQDLQPGEHVLLVGVGTGADLPLLPEGACAVGVDLSTDMLVRARTKQSLPKVEADLIRGDAQSPPLGSEQFDAAVLNLVLSVVPDGAICLRETLRTLQSDGRAVIFDKFAPDEGRTTLGRHLINLVTTLAGTDVTRRFSDVAAECDCMMVSDEPSLLQGAYRVIVVQKQLHSATGQTALDSPSLVVEEGTDLWTATTMSPENGSS